MVWESVAQIEQAVVLLVGGGIAFGAWALIAWDNEPNGFHWREIAAVASFCLMAGGILQLVGPVAGAWPLTIRVGLAALAILNYLAFTHRPYQRRQV